VPIIPKITPDDYPDLLAAVDEGVSERELARRYRCAPSLVHRHVVKARGRREREALQEETDSRATPITGSLREILDARIRDPETPTRDVASLANALTRLNEARESGPGEQLAILFRPGTLILEPQRMSGPGAGQCHFRLLWRQPGAIKQVADQLTAAEVVYLMLCALASELDGLTPEMLGLTSEDLAAAATG
jgi:hypothetical protein